MIPAIVDKITGIKQKLDYENISVARVNGKGSFLIYARMLKCFEIEYLIVGDLDCYKDEVRKLGEHFKLVDIIEQIMKVKTAIGQMEVDYQRINERIKNVDKNFDAQVFQQLLEQIIAGTLEADNADLKEIVSFMQSRYTKGSREQIIIETMTLEGFTAMQKRLRENRIFIWSKGELENYYQPSVQQLTGSKDIKALRLAYTLHEENEQLDKYMTHIPEIEELCGYILKK
ncbi:hypothetical protein SAMN05421821_110199 [Mucilaginibacter lappiensis]|uniref:OLD protein-like TOPRIM domain-containing protein n=1 Tax=Mucilaginibacter lappiensis TaxID=354630 RepID=A0ABR6PQ93_9SPHI|nr:TOPRIM nucleotidyl transferase/hydrolase domain-containing protein [Mucilaginibacter lappiensis]MBB6111180.1 hypothetical protein [Mucilaginibacter lappiensis]SIR70914.1 hypothetical protein SAMN05421821_110199 [Mucilaginibacter lappiensis]